MQAGRLTTIALLAAVGTALFVAESYVPMPMPFLKIGLANASSVVALLLLGPSAMMTVTGIRIVAGSILVGSLFGPGFILSCSAGLVSALVMSAVKKLTGNLFSVIGISLIGSFVHVITQILVVFLLYVKSPSILYLLPLLFFTAIAGGLVVGWVAGRMVGLMNTLRLH